MKLYEILARVINGFHTQHKILEVEKENTATQILLSSLGCMIKLLG